MSDRCPADYPARVETCPECGFSCDLTTAEEAGRAVVEQTAMLVEVVLTVPDVGRRRQPEVWSPLEYACHTRDVLATQRERVLLARRQDRPSLVPMGRDERVEHDGYADQHIVNVVRQLTDAALLFANVLDLLPADAWDRTVVYNYPTRTERSLRWVAVRTLHEVVHHLMDVRRQA